MKIIALLQARTDSTRLPGKVLKILLDKPMIIHQMQRTIVSKLMENGIECRPIVTGNFAKNEVINYFDYEISGSLKNAEYLDKNGFFVGNHQVDIKKMILTLKHVLAEI